jgi:hypothetical protein
MPDIKHQFSSGKMNKDLDERLVPNGEYRDAMNIQVSTSEGSNVGTVQNILGNELHLSAGTTDVTNGAVVAVVGDEKNDMVYWFVQGSNKDCILRKPVNKKNFEFVLVDLHSDSDRSNSDRVLGFGEDGTINSWGSVPKYPKTITGVNILGDLLLWTDNFGEPKKINIPRSIAGTDSSGSEHTKLINVDVGLVPTANLTSSAVDLEEKHVCVIKRGPSNPLSLKYNTTRGRDENKTYSGIVNITDDFGTIANTSALFVSEVEEDNYDFSSYVVGDTMYLTINTDINGNPDFTLQWNVGDKIVLKEFDDDGVAPTTPLRDYRIKGTIVSWVNPIGGGNVFTQDTSTPFFGAADDIYANWSIGRSVVAIKIESINGFPPAAQSGFTSGGKLSYVIDLLDDEAKLYEFKFPRFSYRYKYEDGEYSTFAPWSEIAFLPSAFDSHPQKGYNLGMTNKIQDILMEGFVPLDIPLDVIEVDILYKEDTSTNVYVVETVSPVDSNTVFVPAPFNNIWEYGSYYLTSETIKSLTPSNQLLRTYDTVPRRALGQEVTGNRVVYANYLHQFDLKEGSPTGVGSYFDPKFEISLLQTPNANPNPIKTIKSLREYQLGVVFVDAYGRETPVLSNTTGSIRLDKSHALKGNNLSVSFANPQGPDNMAYFKFYIKETAGEYYNMAMDRFYDAADGNVWLAFASSDRNKIDIDTFLILKKGTGQANVVPDPARYKVLAIENEAPDYVKTTKLLLSTKTHTTSGANPKNLFGTTMEHAPEVGGFKFKIHYSHFYSDNGGDLHNVIQPGVELYIDFKLGINDEVSNKYKVTSISCDYVPEDSTAVPLAQAFYYITVDGMFNDDINFITDDPTGNMSTYILETTQIRFWKHAVENRPQFDGRFFVKIYNDGTFKQYVTKDFDTASANDYKVLSKKKVYLMDQDMHSPEFAGGSVQTWNQGADLGLGEVPHYGTGIPCELGLNTTAWFTQVGNGAYDAHPDYYKRASDTTTPANLQTAGLMDITREGGRSDGGYWRKSQFWAWLVDYHWKTGALGGVTKNMLDDNDAGSSDLDWMGGPHLFDSNGDYEWTAADPSKKPDKKHEVWFIDNGKYIGRHKNGNAIGSFSQSGININIGGYRAGGIQHWSSWPDHCTMSLSFGPVWSSDPSTNTEHFNLGDGSVNYPHQIDFTKRFKPGSKFRWKEDPTQTVYTVGENVEERNQNRYTVPNGPNSGTFEPGLDACADIAPANFTKNYKMKVVPRMDAAWDPTKNTLGPINGGQKIVLPMSDVSASTAMSMTAPMDDVWILMDSIVGVDSNNGNVEAQLTPGMIITRYYDSTLSTNIDLPELATGVNMGTTVQRGGQYLMIDEIEYLADQAKYKVYLVGYRWPLKAIDLPGNPGGWSLYLHGSPGFVPGEDITFHQASMNMISPTYADNWMKMQSQQNSYQYSGFGYVMNDRNTLGALGYTLEFIEHIDREEVMPDYPAVWETEPKEQPELDIYYEIGGLHPLKVDSADIGLIGSTAAQTAVPLNSKINSTHAYLTNEASSVDVILDPLGDLGPGWVGSWIILDGVTLSANVNGVSAGEDVSAFIPLFDLIVTKPDGTKWGPVSVSHIIDANYLQPGVYSANTNHALLINQIGDENSLAFRSNASRRISFDLPYFNAYSFGNGVESNRVRDNFNLPYVLNGVKASTTLAEQYKEERREAGLIYSGIYNSTTGVNNLNQFIQAEKITKDINPTYGSIQKLFSRDTDLVTFCEDKVLKILANKDAVYNADGNPQLIATPNVLGQTIPFSGDYGISTNPESFASESYRAYFTDKQRSVVLRLSQDGLTPISDYGMKDWFKDIMNVGAGDSLSDYGGINYMRVSSSPHMLGTYDTRNNEYNLNIGFIGRAAPIISFPGGPVLYNWKRFPTLLSFKEENKGWVSFKSFSDMEHGISVSDRYFTFKNGEPYFHNSLSVNRNTFYGDYNNSSITVLFNDDPGTVKTFNTLNYEGSQSKVIQFIEYVDSLGFTRTDRDYYNLTAKDGWSVVDIHTDMQDGGVPEFINKENKWFNFITGSEINKSGEGLVSSTLSESEFSFQGLGTLASFSVAAIIPGCTDSDYVEYNPLATVDDGSCMTIAIAGCMNLSATNYDATANVDDGSCLIIGCTDATMFNYDPPPANVPCTDDNGTPNGTVGTGCCTPFITGCMTANIVNSIAATPDVLGACAPPDSSQIIAFPYGPGDCHSAVGGPYFGYDVWHYDPTANTPGVCNPLPTGCIDVNASNYDATALIDDGNCQYLGCTDAAAFNYDSGAIVDDGSCCYISGCTDPASSNYDANACFDDGSCITCAYGCMDLMNANYDPNATCHDCDTYCAGSCGCTDPSAANFDASATAAGTNACTYDGCLDPTAANQLQINGTLVSCLDMDGVYASEANYTGQISLPCGPIPDSLAVMPGIGGFIMDGIYGSNPQTMFDECVYVIPGCTIVTSFNYDANATTDDGSCYPFISGCTDSTAVNYGDFTNNTGNVQVDVNTPDASMCCYTAGCTDSSATNYNGNACWDDGSCTYPVLGCTDDTGGGYWPTVGVNAGYNVMGEATNWNAGNLCSDPQFSTGQFGVSFYVVGTGCVSPSGFLANNYDPSANQDDGSCTYTQGCTDSLSFNYNQVAYYPVSTPATDGCMDSNASNYSATATTDNGSCCYPPIPGCLYENFDSTADGIFDKENYNHGSGSLGNPYNVQGWSQFRVSPTGNINYDVNTHDQQMCILKDGCDEAVVGAGNCPTTEYTVHDNTVNTDLYGERNGAGCTDPIDGSASIIDYWHNRNHNGVIGNYTWGNTGLEPFTMTFFKGNAVNTTTHPFNLNENWSEFATVNQGSVTYPLTTDFWEGTTNSSNWTVGGQGNIDVDLSWQWDPAIQNSCCRVSGCLHPLALNFDLAGYVRNPDSPMDPIYVGVGVQRKDPSTGLVRIMKKADTTTQDFSGTIPYDTPGSYTSSNSVSYTEGGRACQVSVSAAGTVDWGGTGLNHWEGTEGERYQRYFNNGMNEDGTYSGDYGPKKRCVSCSGTPGVNGELMQMVGSSMDSTEAALQLMRIADDCTQWRIDQPEWDNCVFPREWGGSGSYSQNPQGYGSPIVSAWVWNDWAEPTASPFPHDWPGTGANPGSPYHQGIKNSEVKFAGCTKPWACDVPALIPGTSTVNPAYVSGNYSGYNAGKWWDDGSCCLPTPGPTGCNPCTGQGGNAGGFTP